MNPLLSVVVPSRTGRIDTLQAQLGAQSFKDWELIVQSNTSPAARARNEGARRAKGDIIVFMDDDISIERRDLLQELADALKRLGPNDAIGILCALPSQLNAFQRAYAKQVHDPYDLKPAELPGLAKIAWMGVGTACFALRREAFERLGGFDESLISSEDYELDYRLCQAGGQIYVLRNQRVIHPPPDSLKLAVQKAVWYGKGKAQVARKCPSAGYRIALKGRLHAAAYLAALTAMLPLLCVVRLSYHYRRPVFFWRPIAAWLSYVGAFAYCKEWLYPVNQKSCGVDNSTRRAAPSDSRAARAA